MVMDGYLNKANKAKKAPHWCVDHQRWETEPHEESKSLEKWVIVKEDKSKPPEVENLGFPQRVKLGQRVGGLGDAIQFVKPSDKDPAKPLNDAVKAARKRKAQESPGIMGMLRRVFGRNKEASMEKANEPGWYDAHHTGPRDPRERKEIVGGMTHPELENIERKEHVTFKRFPDSHENAGQIIPSNHPAFKHPTSNYLHDGLEESLLKLMKAGPYKRIPVGSYPPKPPSENVTSTIPGAFTPAKKDVKVTESKKMAQDPSRKERNVGPYELAIQNALLKLRKGDKQRFNAMAKDKVKEVKEDEEPYILVPDGESKISPTKDSLENTLKKKKLMKYDSLEKDFSPLTPEERKQLIEDDKLAGNKEKYPQDPDTEGLPESGAAALIPDLHPSTTPKGRQRPGPKPKLVEESIEKIWPFKRKPKPDYGVTEEDETRWQELHEEASKPAKGPTFNEGGTTATHPDVIVGDKRPWQRAERHEETTGKLPTEFEEFKSPELPGRSAYTHRVDPDYGHQMRNSIENSLLKLMKEQPELTGDEHIYASPKDKDNPAWEGVPQHYADMGGTSEAIDDPSSSHSVHNEDS